MSNPTKPLSARAEATTRRTYNRPIDESAQQFETWEDTQNRSIRDHQTKLWTDQTGEPLDEAKRQEVEEATQLGIDRKGMVSGRTMWLGGTPYAYSRPACQFNCSATYLRTVYDMVDAAWLLLNGSGVGGKPQVGTLRGYNGYVPDVQIVPSERTKDEKGTPENVETLPDASNDFTWTISVGDSAPAWAKAFGKMFVPPKGRVNKIVLDYSRIRGPGGRLKGYGWICNGYKPLADAMLRLHNILNAKSGQLLDEIDIGDAHNLFGSVLSSRRAAEILFHDSHSPLIERYKACKDNYYLCRSCGHWDTGSGYCSSCGSNDNNQHRRQSNNSILYWSKPSRAELESVLDHAYHNGDPAPINASSWLRKSPWWALTNPCLSFRTRVLTRQGYQQIGTLVGKEVEVWNGEEWSKVKPQVTGHDQQILEVELSDGTVIECTPYHEWIIDNRKRGVVDTKRVEAKDLKPGDCLARFSMPVVEQGEDLVNAYAHGFFCGDGHTVNGSPRAWLYGKKKELAQYLNLKHYRDDPARDRADAYLPDGMPGKFVVPHNVSLKSRLEWLAGLLDADACIVRNPKTVCVQLASIDLDFLREVRLMLTTMGVSPAIGVMHTDGDRMLPDGKGGKKSYACKKSYRLQLGATEVYDLVQLGLKCNRLALPDEKPQRRAKRFVKVLSVKESHIADKVYCFTEPKKNRGTFEGQVLGQCAEIALSDKGFCNLVTNVMPRFNGNFSALCRAVYIMSRANYRQTCVNLEDGILQPAWHQTNESLRLCGVSLTGIAQMPWLTDYQIRQLRNAAVTGAYSMADELGLPRPKAVTTIKPEGTASKICDVSEGIHTPLGQYIFNWIAFSNNDPLVEALAASGYRTLPHPQDRNNTLVCFPVNYDSIPFKNAGDGKFLNDESAITQLNRYQRWNTLWADHNVSCTISFDREEIPAIVEWLDTNWDHYLSASFLARVDPSKTAKDLGHPYLPQEVVRRDDYFDYQSKVRPVDWDRFHRGWHDVSDASGCEGRGTCPIR